MEKKQLSARLSSLISNHKFFVATLILMFVEAAWTALTGHYPMAFDEDFHLGVIRLYAHHISPFWNSQPANADAFGAVARDPSYLYHYLMSFPYRLIELFTHNQSIQVIILRFINIGLFMSGLIAARQLLLKTTASRTLVHICLLFFVLIPVVSQLAAQINYDNLLLPLTAWTLNVAAVTAQQLTKKQFNVARLIGLLILCLLTSLVKYAFLPVFAAIIIYIAVMAYQLRGADLIKLSKQSWTATGRFVQILLIVGLIISTGLFCQRYAVNLVRYHAPIPDCSKVLSVKQCSAYGPWIRDYNFKIGKVDEEHNPAVYTADWFYGMWLRMYFALDGPATLYQTRGPMIVPAVASIVFAGLGFILTIFYWRQIYRRYNRPALGLLIMACLFYVTALWLDDYKSYLHTGQPVAINGRYLFPILLPIMLIIAMSYVEWLRSRGAWRYAAALIMFFSLAWGGGGLTYILRSNDSWYWHSRPVYDANHLVQNTIGRITPGYYAPIQFLR